MRTYLRVFQRSFPMLFKDVMTEKGSEKAFLPREVAPPAFSAPSLDFPCLPALAPPDAY